MCSIRFFFELRIELGWFSEFRKPVNPPMEDETTKGRSWLQTMCFYSTVAFNAIMKKCNSFIHPLRPLGLAEVLPALFSRRLEQLSAVAWRHLKLYCPRAKRTHDPIICVKWVVGWRPLYRLEAISFGKNEDKED